MIPGKDSGKDIPQHRDSFRWLSCIERTKTNAGQESVFVFFPQSEQGLGRWTGNLSGQAGQDIFLPHSFAHK
jgi:hypothetical protein